MFKRLLSLLTSSGKEYQPIEYPESPQVQETVTESPAPDPKAHDCGHSDASYSLGKDGKTKCRACREDELNV